MALDEEMGSMALALRRAGGEAAYESGRLVVRIPPNANGGGLVARTDGPHASRVMRMIEWLYGDAEGDEYL